MLDKEITLKACRDIIQNAKCDMDKFVKICCYFGYLESSFFARDNREKEYQKLECDSNEANELWEKLKEDNTRINKYVAIIAIESQL